jgi:hypothetical protein
MTSNLPVSAHTSVEALHVLKLLTRRQREQALAHPDLPQLAIGTPLPGTLLHVGLLPRAQFKSMAQRIASGDSDSDDAKHAVRHAQGRQPANCARPS